MGISEVVMLSMMGHMVALDTALGTLIVLGYWSLQWAKLGHLQHIVYEAGSQVGNICGWTGEKYSYGSAGG